ncbi:hypothetical protein BT69DRAFT_1253209 [Atractiella rhizophila]|nr:hypothetical protein BT69DRAFT_1253209 [Atractiella rhizophila]
MAFSIRMIETSLAVLSVLLVTITYRVLILRGSLMSTTAIYPRRSIGRNIGNLLTLAWPRNSKEVPGTAVSLQKDSKRSPSTTKLSSATSKLPAIRLFYLGTMDSDEGIVARGLRDCAAKPDPTDGKHDHSRLWISSGSALTKNVVQLLVWEWVSLWLILIMLFATLLYNSFLTGQRCPDSYPRLTVLLIYTLAYLAHFYYVWTICGSFFTSVAAGAAWSLLQRAKFAICDQNKLHRHVEGSAFEFRGIDKASVEYVPLTFNAHFKHEIDPARSAINGSPSTPILNGAATKEADDLKEVHAALATLAAVQKVQRQTATESATIALDRVITNAMVMMGVTLSSGFSSWTMGQVTDNTPNNFASAQIGSLALLASLSLGTATMFTSAMHLSILDSSFRMILSLKETKINGQAADHYKRRPLSDTHLSFSRGSVPVSSVGFFEILLTNRLQNFFDVLFFGPAFSLMPKRTDDDRTSDETRFDLTVKVDPARSIDGESGTVVFTTRRTNRHGRGTEGRNLEAINVCYIENEEITNLKEKAGTSGIWEQEKCISEQV